MVIKCQALVRAGIGFSAVLLIALGAAGLPAPQGAENNRALQKVGPKRETDLSWVHMTIEDIYDVPVCMQDPVATLPGTYELPVFEIKRNESLAFALDDLCARSVVPLTWGRTRGVLLICPKDAGKGEQTTFLDVPISLSMQNVSTWEAFKAFRAALNEKLGGKGTLDLSLRSVTAKSCHPIPEFLEERTISLELANVPAREAACAIAAASPVEVSWVYIHHKKDSRGSMILRVFKEGKEAFGEQIRDRETFQQYDLDEHKPAATTPSPTTEAGR